MNRLTTLARSGGRTRWSPLSFFSYWLVIPSNRAKYVGALSPFMHKQGAPFKHCLSGKDLTPPIPPLLAQLFNYLPRA
jgi:hypothetical protein